MENKKVKQSIIAGALTGSAGILITKALSLLYVIPFNEIAQDATVFYSYAYTVYDALLQVCLSGIPYAIALLVSKYATKNDYATVRVVKKVSKSIVMIMGVVCCLFMMIFAKPLAYQIVPTELQNTDYIKNTEAVLRILSFALVFVPLLSYYRGFYQGLKELKTYAITQVFEQIVRIAFLLGASCFCVYALNLDRIWAAYMGVASTSVSAIAATLYFINYEKNYYLPEASEPSKYSNVEVFRELIKMAVPYLCSALMLSCSGMFVLLMFSTGLERYGTDAVLITIYQGIINYQAAKLTSIPQVFMSGFCMAIIPHVTEAVTNDDAIAVKSLIHKIVLTLNFLSVPIICLMIFFSEEIYYIMYGNYYLVEGANVLAKLLVCQFFMNFYGITQSILISIQQRTTYLKIEACRLIIMLSIFTPCLSMFGVNGYYLALLIEYIFFITLGFIAINNSYRIGIREIFNKATKSWAGCVPMFIIVAIFRQFNYSVEDNSRVVILFITGIVCGICGIAYLIINYRNGVITELFGFKLSRKTITRLLSKFKKVDED